MGIYDNPEDQRRFERDRRQQSERERVAWNNKFHGEGTYYKKNGSGSSSSAYAPPAPPMSKAKKTVIGVLIVVALIGAFFGIRYMNYTSSESGLYNHYEINETPDGSSSDFINGIENRYKDYEGWYMSVTELPEGYLANIFAFSKDTASVEYWKDNAQDVFRYEFEGNDMGTGLSGRYYLTTVNGKLCIIDYDRDTIYPEGTEFFSKHYKALSKFTYQAIVPTLTEKLSGGTYGKNKEFSTTILKTDNVNACVYEERNETRFLDESGDTRLGYSISYIKTVSRQLPDFSSYKTAELHN